MRCNYHSSGDFATLACILQHWPSFGNIGLHAFRKATAASQGKSSCIAIFPQRKPTKPLNKFLSCQGRVRRIRLQGSRQCHQEDCSTRWPGEAEDSWVKEVPQRVRKTCERKETWLNVAWSMTTLTIVLLELHLQPKDSSHDVWGMTTSAMLQKFRSLFS